MHHRETRHFPRPPSLCWKEWLRGGPRLWIFRWVFHWESRTTPHYKQISSLTAFGLRTACHNSGLCLRLLIPNAAKAGVLNGLRGRACDVLIAHPPLGGL